jgi:hypothetical protein
VTRRSGRTRRTRLDPSFPVHPLLAAAYPVVFLFAANAADQVTLQPLWLPLFAAITGAAVALTVLWAVVRDPWRAGLVVTVLVTLFFWYGHAWNLTGALLGSQVPLIAAWIVAAVGGVVLAVRAGDWRRPASAFLNLVTAALVVFNAAEIAAYSLGGTAAAVTAPSGTPSVQGPESAARPDIYYLIFDRYGSGENLAEHYGFDNSPFLDALRERGFYVADEAHANYIKTPLSLVSSLNMEYLDDEALQAEAASGKDSGVIHRQLRAPLRVPTELKELGYRHVHVANWWEPSATNATADVVLRYEAASEFSSAVLRMSALGAVGAGTTVDPYDRAVLYQHTLYEFGVLEEMADDPDPKFVFAHFLVPHPPYVFRPDGSFVRDEPIETDDERAGYLRQMEYTNDRILGLVDRLLDRPPDERPIILLQADEGPFPARYDADEWRFDWRTASTEEIEEKFGILSAYHLPGVDPEEAGLYPSITPVNSFRVVFDAYFGADLPLLPDRVFAHVSQQDFYEFFEVTDVLAVSAVARTARSASAIGSPPDVVMPSWKARSASVPLEP